MKVCVSERLRAVVAGWWAMGPGGGISCPKGYQGGLLNAIPGHHPPEELYNGDGPADIMDTALDKIISEYSKEWGRPPCKEELKGVLNFCMGGNDEIK